MSGIFVSIPDPVVAEAVAACLTLGTRVMSINAGIDASLELGLLHHIGMVEENAGYAAGVKMAEMATIEMSYCINQFPDLPVLGQVRKPLIKILQLLHRFVPIRNSALCWLCQGNGRS